MTWETAQKEGMTYGEWQYEQSKGATSPISKAVNKPYVAPTPKTISQAVNTPYVAPAIKPASTAPSASTPLIPGMAGTTLTPTAPKPVATTPTAEQIAAMNAVPGSTAEMERQIEAQTKIAQSPVSGTGNVAAGQEIALAAATPTTATGGTQPVTSTPTTTAPTTPTQPTAPTGEGSSADLINNAIANVNAQMETIANTVFDYNPLADQSYLRDAANLENQIVQMMVGRGGMYSSVTQNAISSQMMSLQVDYLEQKRAEYIEDRNFKMSMAQQNFENAMSVASAKNTQEQQALEQAWRELEFKVEQEDRAYQRQQDAQANALALAKFNFDKEMQAAEMNAASNIQSVEAQYAIYQDVYTEFYKQKARWESLQWADSAIVQAYANIGVDLDLNSNLSFAFEANSDAIANLDYMQSNLKNNAVQAGNTADILTALRDLNASSSTIGKTETDVTKTWNATTQEWEYSYKYTKNM